MKKIHTVLILAIMTITLLGLSTSAMAVTYTTQADRAAHNEEMMTKAKATSSKYFLEKSMFDMFEVGNGLNSSDLKVIAELKDKVLADAGNPTTDYDKAKAFNEFIRENFYYCRTADQLSIVKKYGSLTDSPLTLTKMYNDMGKCVARCNGYTSLFIAFCRLEGIPARQVDGYYNEEYRHIGDNGNGWAYNDSKNAKRDHVWPMAYIDGKWLVLDSCAECYNQYNNGSSEPWRVSGSSFIERSRRDYFGMNQKDFAQSHVIILFRAKPSLSKPGVVAPTSPSKGKLKIKWKYSYKAEKYKIYRATSKSGTYKLVKTYTDTNYKTSAEGKVFSYTDTVSSGKTYYYKIKAVHGNTSSSYSSVVSKRAN